MARVYQMPPNTSEKEKAIGGILTFSQFGWLILGLIICLIIFAFCYLFTGDKVVGIVLGAPFLPIGVPFAFYKKYEMPLLKYLSVKRKFNQKTHKLINKKRRVTFFLYFT